MWNYYLQNLLTESTVSVKEMSNNAKHYIAGYIKSFTPNLFLGSTATKRMSFSSLRFQKFSFNVLVSNVIANFTKLL